MSWIKMRAQLRRDPKVVAMAKYLISQDDFKIWNLEQAGYTPSNGVTKTVTPSLHSVTGALCGALLDVWSTLNEMLDDEGVSDLMDLSYIDHIAQMPLLGKAMEKVGWVVGLDGSSLMFPNFTEFNVTQKARGPAMTNAERQKKYREKKKASQSNVTGVTESNARIDKNRVDKKSTPQTPQGDCVEEMKKSIHEKAAAIINSPISENSENRNEEKPPEKKKRQKHHQPPGAPDADEVVRQTQNLKPDGSWKPAVTAAEMSAIAQNIESFAEYPWQLVREWLASDPDKPPHRRYNFFESGGQSERSRAEKWRRQADKQRKNNRPKPSKNQEWKLEIIKG